jgi:hypothetical protein
MRVVLDPIQSSENRVVLPAVATPFSILEDVLMGSETILMGNEDILMGDE